MSCSLYTSGMRPGMVHEELPAITPADAESPNPIREQGVRMSAPFEEIYAQP